MPGTDLDLQIAAAVARIEGIPGPAMAAVTPLSAMAMARLIDHTVLKPETVEEQVRTLCLEALTYHFASVCVNPTWVPLCTEILRGSEVKVDATIGFPLGATLPAVKAYEVEQVALAGAQEVDMVISVGRLRDGDHHAVYRDIGAVVDVAHDHGLLVKVILETSLLTDAQKIAACVIAQEAGADFVKTSTGFGGGGATEEDIALMRRVVGPLMGVKASGGVRTAEDALRMVAAGANRIGTSAGIKIVQGLTNPAGS